MLVVWWRGKSYDLMLVYFLWLDGDAFKQALQDTRGTTVVSRSVNTGNKLVMRRTSNKHLFSSHHQESRQQATKY